MTESTGKSEVERGGGEDGEGEFVVETKWF